MTLLEQAKKIDSGRDLAITPSFEELEVIKAYLKGDVKKYQVCRIRKWNTTKFLSFLDNGVRYLVQKGEITVKE